MPVGLHPLGGRDVPGVDDLLGPPDPTCDSKTAASPTSKPGSLTPAQCHEDGRGLSSPDLPNIQYVKLIGNWLG